MKKMIVLYLVLAFLASNPGKAQFADQKEARSFALAWLQGRQALHTIAACHEIIDDRGMVLSYCFPLLPEGFLVTTANRSLPPLLAYSFNSTAPDKQGHESPLADMIRTDVSARLEYLGSCTDAYIQNNRHAWAYPSAGAFQSRAFQQWPPDGSTSTGGWLETNWKQSYPCNIFCPLDPVTGERSLAGCPSVALAMIIDYQKNLNGTVFNDNDDYFHSYASRQYWIDDDYEAIDFLSFPQINKYFDSIALKYDGYELLNEEEIATLIWACGIAARQVYTSNGSGTFGVDQAYAAYQRFGYMDAALLYESDTSLFTRMKYNMMDGIPAHYAVLSNTGSGGHNVVVDGYNTENYYHVNFGWGGNYNAWYLLPQELPYNLTITEGAIVDIGTTYVSISDPGRAIFPEVDIFPNPSFGAVKIKINLQQAALVKTTVFNQNGKLVDCCMHACHAGLSEFPLELDQAEGIYLVHISSGAMHACKKILICK